MRRREFISFLSGAATAWPLAANAQQPAMPVVGFVHSQLADTYGDRLRAFRQGLADAGYVEGRNVAVEWRQARPRRDRRLCRRRRESSWLRPSPQTPQLYSRRS